MQVRVLDLDGVGAQACIAARAPVVVAARDLAPRLRLWASDAAFAELGRRIAARPVEGPSVTFIGSGDFHNLTPLLLAEVDGPLVVVHVDNHPDWVKLAPRRHCGAWVNRALELPHVLKVITVGPTSADLDSPDVKGGAFEHLAAGRIEMFPWRRPPSRLRRPLSDGPGHSVREGRLHWREVGDGFEGFLPALIARIPEDARVWLTIDKDALRPEDAGTNWDQGEMSLAALVALIEAVAASRTIAGADICGDWSKPRYDNPLKAIEAFFDRPKGTARTAPVPAVNERTNARLLEVLDGALPSPSRGEGSGLGVVQRMAASVDVPLDGGPCGDHPLSQPLPPRGGEERTQRIRPLRKLGRVRA